MNEEYKPEKLGLFDVINILNMKGDIPDDDVIKDSFIPFMVNRAFSNLRETVFFANEMNRYAQNLTKRQQFDFWYYGLPKKKRYGKWHKVDGSDREDLDLIKEFYGYNETHAIEVLGILRAGEQLGVIRTALEKGGQKLNQRNKK